MRSKIEFFLILTLFTSVLWAFTPERLVRFYSKIAGHRDFYVEFSLEFHVKDENEGYKNFSMAGKFVMRNFSDFYLYIEKPQIIGGIKFIYISDTGKLFSGFDNRMYLDKVDFPEENVIKYFKTAVEIITSPIFLIKEHKDGSSCLYQLTLANQLILKRFGIEPIKVELGFVGEELRFIKITDEKGEEYVKISIKKISFSEDVSSYFKIAEGT